MTAQTIAPRRPAWWALISLTVGVFGLVTAEFLPVSLLTPMAADLAVSEGVAGQAVSITSAAALVTSLLISAATRSIDRRYVLSLFSVLLIGSNVIVASAANIETMFAGRVLLGTALGGFWAMSAATVMRLVPQRLVPRALSVLYGGVSFATVVAAPLGSYLGEFVGWRDVFLLTTVIGGVALVLQLGTLPVMTPSPGLSMSSLIKVATLPRMRVGIISVLMIISGNFALFTYIRPFLEQVTGAGISGIATVLLGFGIGGFIGSAISSFLIERNLRLTLAGMPFAIGLAAIVLVVLPSSYLVHISLITLWGIAFGVVPVSWSTWITKTVPNDAESGGSIFIATYHSAIVVGVAAGGILFDAGGSQIVYGSVGAVMVAAAIFVLLRLHMLPEAE